MRLLIINGSPRAKKSNTRILLESFLEGFNPGEEDHVDTEYLMTTKDMAGIAARMNEYDKVILGFPLYTDAMPGIVKEFMEHTSPYAGNSDFDMGFLVQSGFPEGRHCSYVIRYLEEYCRRLGANYLGSISKGGVEGLQAMPDSWIRKRTAKFTSIGAAFRQDPSHFDDAMVSELLKPWRFSRARIFGYRILSGIGLTDMYWNSQMKKNNAFDKRISRPHETEQTL